MKGNDIQIDSDINNILLLKGDEFFLFKEYDIAIMYYLRAMKVDPYGKDIILEKGNELFK